MRKHPITAQNTRFLAACMFLLAVAAVGAAPGPQATAAQQLLDRAVAFHDPNGVWENESLRFEITMAHSRWWSRDVQLTVDNRGELFQSVMDWNGELVEVGRRSGEWSVLLNGSSEMSQADRDRHDLNADELQYWQDYFLYVFGLPMKWLDPGTIIDPEPVAKTIKGVEVLELRATYDPQVGSHIWYLYLDPDTARLVGAKFYLVSEADGNGFTIMFEDEVVVGGMRVPKLRHWYTNRGDRLVGTDSVDAVAIIP